MSTKAVRSLLWLALAGLLVATPVATASPPPAAALPSPAGQGANSEGVSLAPIDPTLFEIIKLEGQARFDVVLKLQADLSGAVTIAGKEAKGQYVYHALTTVASQTQGPLIAFLKARNAAYRSFWIQNMVRIWGDKDLLLEVAARSDVAEIIYEYPAVLDVGQPGVESASEAIEWNILRVNADDVWGMGVTGEGAVVGDLDTGVQWDHPALKQQYRGCQDEGCTVVDHNYNWYEGPSGSPVPYDTGSHGTHTMGTIVGDDGGTNQIGMAPGAKWIACPGIGSPLVGPFECFQFFLAPTKLDGSDPQPALAPHVINNSWSSSGTDYHAAIQALYAAGVFYAKSAGNTGSACSTITNPGQWPEVTAAAAFASGDVIASFSSRGPVTIGHDLFVKPDIAAPGVSVRSSIPGNSYGSMQGTSMACPHITGAVALLVSANPELAGEIDVLQKLLKQTAEEKVSSQCPPFVDRPNDVWGWGILNAYGAAVAAQDIALGEMQGTVYDASTNLPVAEAVIAFEDTSGWAMAGRADGSGAYAKTLPADSYTLTTSAFGYLPKVDPGIVVLEGETTTHDVTLSAAPKWTVSGYVTELGTGNPLAATAILDGTPLSAETDPATGFYSLEVPQGTYWLEVSSPGHLGASVQLVVESDLSQDFGLEAVWNYPMRSSHDPCDPVQFAWIDATGGTAHCLSDDAAKSVSLPTGRSFSLYNSAFSTIYLISNGNVLFGTNSTAWSGPIPDPALPNNGIYAFSTDLNPSSCGQGTIYTHYVDDRYFVVEWHEVQHYPSGSPETFEIILDLDTGQVVVQYLVVSDPSSALSGVENANGTVATQYAFGDPALLSNETRVEYDPVFGTPPLQGPGSISGTVSDARTLVPIGGATVEAAGSGETYSAVTGPDGGYAFAALCPDIYTLSATAEGYYPSDEETVELGPAASVTHDFALVPIKFYIYLPFTTLNYP
jgi:subtilisin family serine protease